MNKREYSLSTPFITLLCIQSRTILDSFVMELGGVPQSEDMPCIIFKIRMPMFSFLTNTETQFKTIFRFCKADIKSCRFIFSFPFIKADWPKLCVGLEFKPLSMIVEFFVLFYSFVLFGMKHRRSFPTEIFKNCNYSSSEHDARQKE